MVLAHTLHRAHSGQRVPDVLRSTDALGSRLQAVSGAPRPTRARSGPSSSTEPRSLPTSATVRRMAVDTGGPDTKRRAPNAINLGAQVHKQLRHDLDVTDARHIRQDALVLSQQARRQQWQRGILVTLHVPPDPATDARLQSTMSTCNRIALTSEPSSEMPRRDRLQTR